MGLTTVCVAAWLRCPSKAWDPTARRCANMSVRVFWKGELPVNTACGSPFEVSRAQACKRFVLPGHVFQTAQLIAVGCAKAEDRLSHRMATKDIMS